MAQMTFSITPFCLYPRVNWVWWQLLGRSLTHFKIFLTM